MQILTVSEAVAYLRELLESDLVLGDVWVAGEVSGPRTQPSGHTYFAIKDGGAQLRGVLFRSAQVRQRRIVDYLAQGAQVILHGRLTVYEARGELQIVVDFVQPEGVGLSHAQFERLRTQLEEEGLFEAARKRPLPRFPERVGVVTSPAGAVFHDICNVLRRRWPVAEVVLAPTPVQGPEAVPGVLAAIEALNGLGDIDVIIVARGGGAAEELWAFNDEAVARAVFGSLVPVVSAVGHETDFTICDYVADLRAPTPSAAAEIVAPDLLQIAAELDGAARLALRLVDDALVGLRSTVGGVLARAGQAVVDPDRLRQGLKERERRTILAVERLERERSERLRHSRVQLAALDPQATLNRGYAVVHKGGEVVSSIGAVSQGDDLTIKVADGGFPASVTASGRRRRAAKAAARRNGVSDSGERGVQSTLFP